MFKRNKCLIAGIALFLVFVIFTICIKFVDVAAVGPLGSKVGFSHLNNAVFKFIGESDTWFKITEVLGIISLLVAGGFAVFGMIQLIKRKKLKLIDNNIFMLGIFYVVVALLYLMFEIVVVNKRPILIGGELETSYPSSHTMLSVFIMGSAMIQFHKLIGNKKRLVFALDIISFSIIGFTVIGRLLSGMHWITDIFAGLLISLSLMFLYCAVIKIIEDRKVIKEKLKDSKN